MNDANVALDTMLSLQVENLRLENALRLLLRDLDLKYLVYEEVLFITTKDVADDMTDLCIYPVLDLVDQPELNVPPGPWSRFRQDDYNSLSDVIQNHVKPDSWAAVGGPGGLARFPAVGAIPIPQTVEVHDQIPPLLAMLRRTRTQQFEGPNLKPLKERTWSAVDTSASSPKIRQTLDVRADFDEDKTPLNSMLKYIGDKWKIVVLLDTGTVFQQLNIEANVPISFKAKNCRLEEALNQFLAPHQLGWIELNEALLITTQEDIADMPLVRGYPISDLKESEQMEFTNHHWQEAESLRSALEISVEPDSWNINHGPGFASYFPNSSTLIVSQTEDAHKKIEAFLVQIRKLRDQQMPSASPLPAVDLNDPTLHTKVYHVPVWLSWAVRRMRTVPMDGMAGMGMGLGMGGAASQPRVDPAAELVKLIPQSIEPKSWQSAGGKGSLHALEGRLIIRQTNKVHEQLARLLRIF